MKQDAKHQGKYKTSSMHHFPLKFPLKYLRKLLTAAEELVIYLFLFI